MHHIRWQTDKARLMLLLCRRAVEYCRGHRLEAKSLTDEVTQVIATHAIRLADETTLGPITLYRDLNPTLVRAAQIRAWTDIMTDHLYIDTLQLSVGSVRHHHQVTTVSDREWPATLAHVNGWDDAAAWRKLVYTLIDLRLCLDYDPMRPLLQDQYDHLAEVLAERVTHQRLRDITTDVGLAEVTRTVTHTAILCLASWFDINEVTQ